MLTNQGSAVVSFRRHINYWAQLPNWKGNAVILIYHSVCFESSPTVNWWSNCILSQLGGACIWIKVAVTQFVWLSKCMCLLEHPDYGSNREWPDIYWKGEGMTVLWNKPFCGSVFQRHYRAVQARCNLWPFHIAMLLTLKELKGMKSHLLVLTQFSVCLNAGLPALSFKVLLINISIYDYLWMHALIFVVL